MIAAILGNQINAPNSRIIKALAGVVLFIVSYRAKPFYALCFITLLFPFPFSIFVGSSTMIFVVLASVIYLGRLTLRQVPPLVHSPVDVAIGILMAAYLLSFYNIENPTVLEGAVKNMFGIVSSFLLYFMMVNFIRTEAQLRTYMRIFGITVALCIFVGTYELFFPGRVLVPNWILYSPPEVYKGYRVTGPFNDYELFGEFMAIVFFSSFFLYRRASTPNHRFFTLILSVLTVFMLLTTVTRGATLSFMGGILYLLWVIRRRLSFRSLVIASLVGIGLYFAMNFVVVHFTESGSVLDRLLGTTFVGGLPESRSDWPEILSRALEHPFIGHGAFYDLGLTRGFTGKGLYTYLWPHNQYLFYLHTVGLIGTGAFLFITLRVLWLSFRWKAPGLDEASYPRSLMTALHVMLLVFLVDQIKIDYLRNQTYQYFPWLLMGLIVATYRIIRAQEEGGANRPETG